MIHVRPAYPADADALAPRLRPADLRELDAALALPPATVLQHGVRASNPCQAIVHHESVLGLFGVVPSARNPEVGAVWLLGSEEFASRPLFIARWSKVWIAKLHERYRVLGNYVDARNEVHIRWLRWCGFAFVRKIERFGVQGIPFYEVRREREVDAPRLVHAKPGDG